MHNINLDYRYRFVQKVAETLALLNAAVVPALVCSFVFWNTNNILIYICSFLFAPIVVSVALWAVHRLHCESLKLTGGHRLLSWIITAYTGFVAELIVGISFWALLQAMLPKAG